MHKLKIDFEDAVQYALENKAEAKKKEITSRK